MKRALLLLVSFFSIQSVPETAADCPNPERYARSVVSLITYDTFGKPRNGTGWFYKSTRFLVTAGHVARSFDLSRKEWREIEMRQEAEPNMPRRVTRAQAQLAKIGDIGNRPDFEVVAVERFALQDLALIELKESIFLTNPLNISAESIAPNTPVTVFSYPFKKLRITKARTVPRDIDQIPDRDFIEMIHIASSERFALTNGSSGAPVINCGGYVIGVNTILLSDVFFHAGKIMTRDKPGRATNFAVPIQKLENLVIR